MSCPGSVKDSGHSEHDLVQEREQPPCNVHVGQHDITHRHHLPSEQRVSAFFKGTCFWCLLFFSRGPRGSDFPKTDTDPREPSGARSLRGEAGGRHGDPGQDQRREGEVSDPSNRSPSELPFLQLGQRTPTCPRSIPNKLGRRNFGPSMYQASLVQLGANSFAQLFCGWEGCP